MTRLMRAAFVGLLTICAPSAVFASETNACVTAWQTDVQPMINSRCVACHQNAAPAGDLSLQRGTAPENLIGQISNPDQDSDAVQSNNDTEQSSEPGQNSDTDQTNNESELVLVTPGSLEDSYLFRKLEGTHIEAGGTGERMPLGGELSEADLEIVANWILGCEDA